MSRTTRTGLILALSLAASTSSAWTGPTTSVLVTPMCKTYGCTFLDKVAYGAGGPQMPKATTQYIYHLSALPYRDSVQDYRRDPRNRTVFAELQVWRAADTGAIHEVSLSWNADDYSPSVAQGQKAIALLARTYIKTPDLKKLGFSTPEALARQCYPGAGDLDKRAGSVGIICSVFQSGDALPGSNERMGPAVFSFGIFTPSSSR